MTQCGLIYYLILIMLISFHTEMIVLTVMIMIMTDHVHYDGHRDGDCKLKGMVDWWWCCLILLIFKNLINGSAIIQRRQVMAHAR